MIIVLSSIGRTSNILLISWTHKLKLSLLRWAVSWRWIVGHGEISWLVGIQYI